MSSVDIDKNVEKLFKNWDGEYHKQVLTKHEISSNEKYDKIRDFFHLEENFRQNYVEKINEWLINQFFKERKLVLGDSDNKMCEYSKKNEFLICWHISNLKKVETNTTDAYIRFIKLSLNKSVLFETIDMMSYYGTIKFETEFANEYEINSFILNELSTTTETPFEYFSKIFYLYFPTYYINIDK